MSTLEDLKERLGVVADLDAAAAGLGWDQETYMPPGAIEARAAQLTTLARLSHETFTDEAIGRLLEAAATELDDASFESDDASLVRVATRDWERATKIPADLVARLTGPAGMLAGARVAVLAAAEERDQVQPLLAAVPAERLLNLVGRTGLPVAAAVLRRCAFFVGNDSGLMHMAAAVGTPTLGLFGPSHTTHYAPWGPRAAWVRTAKPYAELVGGPGYDHRNTGTLMASLSVDSVTRAARLLWQRVANAGGAA